MFDPTTESNFEQDVGGKCCEALEAAVFVSFEGSDEEDEEKGTKKVQSSSDRSQLSSHV